MSFNEKKSMWSFKLSTAALVLIPAAVGINYIGKTFAGVLKLPLWLDSIGTILASMLAGPVVGALVGLINNIIHGLTQSPISFVYAITQVGIGVVAGVLAKKGYIKNLQTSIIAGLLIGLVAVVISTPLNIIFWGGQTGNIWGDAAFAAMQAKGQSVWLSSLVDEIVVDIPDKIVTVIVCYLIYKGLPQKLTLMYDDQDIQSF
ncbi:ECF transporter S component [Vagococcus fessus]|nr:ECF transporter S component [Vagococcus fessus]